MIDIKRLLSTHQISWVDKGPNVAKGNINIKCPFCGSDDHSEHMGINPITLQWGCWRNQKHRGKNIARLLAKFDIYITEDKSETIQKLINKTFFNVESTAKQEVLHRRNTVLPEEFIPIVGTSAFDSLYQNYLKQRGFPDPVDVADQYGLCQSTSEKWSGRLIIPIWCADEVTWTGRAIGESSLRYLSPKAEEALNIKQTLWNYNALAQTEGDVLVICEGPFDSLKVDYYNKPSIRATCLFGLMASEAQLKLLNNICTRFNTIILGLDEGTLSQSLVLRKHLTNFSPSIAKLSSKDWGSMEPREAREVIESYL